MASYILQRKLPWRVYREIGGIRALLENITPPNAVAHFKFPDARLRVRVQDSNRCGERPRLRLEKSHFLSFHRFSLLSHPSLLYFTDVHPFRSIPSSSPPTFALFLSPLFLVKTRASASLLIKRNVVRVNICGGKSEIEEKNATSKGRFLRLRVSLFIERETGRRPRIGLNY